MMYITEILGAESATELHTILINIIYSCDLVSVVELHVLSEHLLIMRIRITMRSALKLRHTYRLEACSVQIKRLKEILILSSSLRHLKTKDLHYLL